MLPPKSERNYRTVTLTNMKGGVGKTTVSTNLAIAFALLQKRVLLMDMDYQFNTTEAFGQPEAAEGKSAFEALYKKTLLQDPGAFVLPIYFDRDGNKIDLLPSNTDPSVDLAQRIARRDAGHPLYDEMITDFLKAHGGNWDVILFDTHPALAEYLSTCAMYSSDLILVPLNPHDPWSRRRFPKFLRAVSRIEEHARRPLDVRVLINFYEEHELVARRNIQEMMTDPEISKRVFNTRIPRSTALQKGAEFNMPALALDPTTPAAKAFLDLAKETLESYG